MKVKVEFWSYGKLKRVIIEASSEKLMDVANALNVGIEAIRSIMVI